MIAHLTQLVRDRTLRSRFYGIRGALLLDEGRAYYLRKLGRRAESFSTRTSTYYAAARTARARSTNSPTWAKPWWGLLGFLCKIRLDG